MKYLKNYASRRAYEQDAQAMPFVGYIEDEGVCLYNEVNRDLPLFIEAREDLRISFTDQYSKIANGIYYSLDNENWVALSPNTLTPFIPKGNRVYFLAYQPSVLIGIGTFEISGRCDVGGNVMSMYYGSYFKDVEEIGDADFHYLFRNASLIINADRLILPATTLSTGCYNSMFQGCTSLQTTPELPATTLATQCYYAMFNGCKSLVTAPKLPATTLAEQCYAGMFTNCIKLVNAAKLPATTLEYGCYMEMYSYCSSLVTAPDLPATIAAQHCYNGMFAYCESLVNAPAIALTGTMKSCCSSMFKGCTSLVTAPELLPEILAQQCYNNMFQNCSSLNYIKMLATDISAAQCLENWVKGVSNSGTFVKSPMIAIPGGWNGVPEGWSIQNAS